MSLKDVIGQERVIQGLHKSLKENNLFHAYIFEGPNGMGKRFTAINFAKALLCQSPTKYDACESCRSCKKMNTHNHPDYYYIDSEDSIKDGQIEEIQKIMSKKPYESENTVFIINDADTMTPRAQNRLLKTLEEPNINNIMILLTENLNRILPTVSSRCMILKFKPVIDEMMCSYLMKRYSIDFKDSKILTAYSQGRIGIANNMYNSEDFKEKRNKSLSIVQRMTQLDEEFFNIISELDNQKNHIFEFLDMIEYWYRDMVMILSAGCHEDLLMNVDHVDTLLQEANKIGYEKAIRIISLIEVAKKEISMNLNFNLVIKNMLFKIQEG